MRHRLTIILICLAAPAIGLAAEVFTTTGSNGERVYTDRPRGDAQKVQINVPGRRNQVAPPAAETEPEERSPCEQARFVLSTYEAASYLAEKTVDGKTRVLSAEEAQEKIEQARRDERRLCKEEENE